MLALSRRVIPLLRRQLQKHTHDPEQHKRLETLGRVLRYIAAVIITLIAAMLVLSELGISIAPILASAGIVGLAIGFGAQTLVKDYFTGFFLLLENQVRQGDVVEWRDWGDWWKKSRGAISVCAIKPAVCISYPTAVSLPSPTAAAAMPMRWSTSTSPIAKTSRRCRRHPTGCRRTLRR